MQIGSYQVSAIETGEFRLDGGAMFGVVPKVLWQKSNPPDTENRIQMALRSCLIRGNGKTLLVDTGIGEFWNEKQRKQYAIDHSKSNLTSSLREEITDVILSHLHFDHVGGAASKTGLNFPNAKYHVQKANLTHAHAPTEKDRASFIENTLSPLLGSPKLTIHDGDFEIAPGVSVWVTHGHTPGHQMVKISDGKTTVLCPGDTIPTASHIPIPYVMAYDLYPLTTMEEKRKILKHAVLEKWVLFFVHDPFRAATTVNFQDGKYSMLETVRI